MEEQEKNKTESQTETLADLEINQEQTEEVKGAATIVVFAVNGIRDRAK